MTAYEEELESERAYLERVRERLLTLQGRAVGTRAVTLQSATSSMQGAIERDILATHWERRARQLGDVARPSFGRLDLVDDERYYIGKFAVTDEDGEPLVVDWRAPVAAPFYTASPGVTAGVLRRRHFQYRANDLVGLDDELFDDPDRPHDGIRLAGSAALLAALEAPRTGHMSEVAATIQGEQYEIIQLPAEGVLLVQGGAGTGKTVVALHRAAYLLYQSHLRVSSGRMLVIVPTTALAAYVEGVLPGLGEHAVRPVTLAAVLGYPELVQRESDPAVEKAKSTAALATVVARAVRDRERALRQEAKVSFGRFVLRLSVADSQAIVRRARRASGSHNARAQLVERLAIRTLWEHYSERVARPAVDAGPGAGPERDPGVDPGPGAAFEVDAHREAVEVEAVGVEALTRNEFAGALRTNRTFKIAVGKMWPVLTAKQLLGDLFAHPALLARATRGVLDDAERDLLARDAGTPWTVSDAPLLHEAASLLGSVSRSTAARQEVPADDALLRTVDDAGINPGPCRKCGRPLDLVFRDRWKWRCACGATWALTALLPEGVGPRAIELLNRLAPDGPSSADPSSSAEEIVPYFHAIIDEAQDLSEMELRAIRRHLPSLSITLLGDMAQTTRPGAIGSWDGMLDVLQEGEPVAVTRRTLSLNYRVPQEVAAVSERLLAVSGREGAIPRAVRAGGERHAEVATDVEAAIDRWVQRLLASDGSIGVIVAAGLRSKAEERFAASERVEVFTIDDAKGLEFDSVVVADPSRIMAEAGGRSQALYIAATRATQRLVFLIDAASDEGIDHQIVGWCSAQ